MAKRKTNSFKQKLAIIALLVAIILGAVQFYFPEQFEEARAKITALFDPKHASSENLLTDTKTSAADAPTSLVPENFAPSIKSDVQILKNIGYVSAFSNTHEIPLWVGYLATYPFKFDTVKRPAQFLRDLRARGCPEHRDYSNSGYDRGHMAPNYVIGRCWGPKAQMETFYLTNIVPQRPNMNRGVWAEIERNIADNVSKKFGAALVFVGPVLDNPPAKIRGKNISIPSACFAVILVKDKQGQYLATAFVVPQAPLSKNIWDYCVPVDEVEKLTGIDFLPQLPDDIENRIESAKNAALFN